VQIAPDGKSRGSWILGGGEAKRLGVPNAEANPNSHVRSELGETEIQAMQRVFPHWFGRAGTDQLIKTNLGPGEYYRRMARPSDQHLLDSPGYYPGLDSPRPSPHDPDALTETAIAHGQIGVLTEQLKGICQTIHPVGQNLTVYGHEIRNLLILASTEVEASWRGILVGNHASPSGRDFTTKDYVKLAPALKLREYAVHCSAYPWMDIIKPFERWGSTSTPTKDLPWYDAYNSVKHDREGQFHRATLETVFHAVAACFVMLFAQYGLTRRLSLRENGVNLLNLVETPNWSAADCYLGPHNYNGGTPAPFPLKAVDYPF
jgi:hypothetical protein